MTVQEIAKILETHGINYEITGNKIIADSDYTLNGIQYTDKVNLSDMNKNQLYDWLGY